MKTIRELHKRSYRGEKQGSFVAYFLNDVHRDGSSRALKLFQELKKLSPVAEPTGGGDCHPNSPVNRLLRRYWCYPALVFIEPAGKFEFAFTNNRRPLNYDPFAEWQAVDGITTLGELGLLHRLRQCKTCGKWLYARFERQTHCTGTSCRSQEYQSTAEWKEKRRLYMRRYRAQPDQQRSKVKSVKRRKGK